MDEADDLDNVRTSPIDEDIVRVDHRLARAGRAARTVEERVFRQSLGASLDRSAKALGGGEVAIGDLGEDLPEFLARALAPDEGHHARWRCRASSMIAFISAMTTSCATDEHSSASEAANFALSHSS